MAGRTTPFSRDLIACTWGLKGFATWYQTVVVEAWEDFRVDVEELFAPSTMTQVLVSARSRRHGASSGARVTFRPFSLRPSDAKNGREATSVRATAEALEAAGRPKWAMSQENVEIVRALTRSMNAA